MVLPEFEIINNHLDSGTKGNMMVNLNNITGQNFSYTAQTPDSNVNISTVAMSSDSMGNIFVLWSNGKVFERPDMSGKDWIFLGNSEAIGSYDNNSVNLGKPIGIRASYNWENSYGKTTGMVMVLFSNGYASMASYGVNPIVWKLSKLPSGNNYVSLSYNLAGFSYIGAHNQVFYATEKNGITYGYSDRYYNWTSIISGTVNNNITSTLAWSNNFSPPSTGTVIMLAISHSGYIYFAEGSTNPLKSLVWVGEGKISTSNPDFIGLTQTPNPSSDYYYYAIEGKNNSTLFASTVFNGTGTSFFPISNTTTPFNQTAIQNKYFGFETQSNELILLQNGEIYQTKNEGGTYNLFLTVPKEPQKQKEINVMPWIYQANMLQESLQELNMTHNNYTMVSYEFYQLQPDEQITAFEGYTNASNPANITPLIHKYGLGAVPMIVSASGQLIYRFTSNSYVMSLAIQQMAEYAVLYNYTGYDIDWEPASTNNTTGLLFDNFINQFSLVLDKFGKKLFVEVASWDPDFWNYTNLGRTNVTSINIMDYGGIYSGNNSFLSNIQQGINEIPSGKLSISLENVNPNTCSNFTSKQMGERFSALEKNNIKFIGIWDMPLNISIISQIEDYSLNNTGTNYSYSFSPGSSGISIINTGNAVSGKIDFSYYKDDYLSGNGNYSTNFAPGTLLTHINYNYSGSSNILLYIEDNNSWQFLKTITSSTDNKITLPVNTENVRFLFGNFTGVCEKSDYSAKLNYTIGYNKIVNFAWINVYYQNGSSIYINGIPAKNLKITEFGQWDMANISLLAGSYNISIEKYQFLGYFDNINVSAEHVTIVYTEIETLLGKVIAKINPYNAIVKINGNVIETINGKFNYTAIEGNYTLTINRDFYNNITKNITINRGSVTYINVNLTYLSPSPVIIKMPEKITRPTFAISWSKFTGIDFNNYSIYISTNNMSIGKMIYSINSINDTTYNLTNLSYSTTYYVTVETNAQNSHSYSNKISFTTSPQRAITSQQKVLDIYVYIIIGLLITSAIFIAGFTIELLKKRR